MTQARIKHKTICQLTSPMSDKPSDIFRMLLLEEKRKKEKKKERKKKSSTNPYRKIYHGNSYVLLCHVDIYIVQELWVDQFESLTSPLGNPRAFDRGLCPIGGEFELFMGGVGRFKSFQRIHVI